MENPDLIMYLKNPRFNQAGLKLERTTGNKSYFLFVAQS